VVVLAGSIGVLKKRTRSPVVTPVQSSKREFFRDRVVQGMTRRTCKLVEIVCNLENEQSQSCSSYEPQFGFTDLVKLLRDNGIL
jgi:hypothetical protein